eukprot:5827929-Heterocapsa_arctica.AAC.1
MPRHLRRRTRVVHPLVAELRDLGSHALPHSDGPSRSASPAFQIAKQVVLVARALLPSSNYL